MTDKETALWHEVDEKEREQIREKSKKILDDFAKKLEKIKTDESVFESDSGLREDGEPWKTDEDFKSTMFSNASDVQDDFIVAEKGGWK